MSEKTDLVIHDELTENDAVFEYSDEVFQLDWTEKNELLAQDELKVTIDWDVHDAVIEYIDEPVAIDELIEKLELFEYDELFWFITIYIIVFAVFEYEDVKYIRLVSWFPNPSVNIEPDTNTDDV